MQEPESVGNPRVSLTAYATASAWAHFGFEHAEWFQTRRGHALFTLLRAGCRAVRPLSPAAGAFAHSLYWRHRWFSAWAETRAPALAVEIGAGLSTQGLVHADRHPDCAWVDYDLPDMTAARRKKLHGHALPDNYHLRVGDVLSTNLGDELAAPVAGRTIVMLEGVMDYLDHAEKRRAWTTIAALLKRLGGGRLLCDIHPRSGLADFGGAAPAMLGALRRISGRDLAAQLFASTDDALDGLRACGFTAARALPEAELDTIGAPPPDRRAFRLIEANIAA